MEMPSAIPKPHDDRVVEAPRKGRFIVNLAANMANFSLTILVGLWLVPYFIRHLGVAAYGLVPLATTLTAYMALFTISLNSAVGRFMTIALDRRDYGEANSIFNTSFWGSLAVVIVLLGPAFWLTSQARLFFNVPPGYEEQFVWLLRFVIGVFFLTTLRFPFNTSSFCCNRFELSNAVTITETLVRVAVIVLLFTFLVPQVWYIGLAMLCASGGGFLLSIVIWRYLTPMLTVRWRDFSRRTLKKLTGTGFWIFITQIGAILYLSIDLIVVNKMIGAEAGGKYGAIMIWSNNLRSLAGVLSGVFTPTIISLYGRQDITGLVAYARRAVKFVGLLLGLPIGLICGLAQPLLHVWLGPSFEPLAPLMTLMSIHLCVNLAILPLFAVMIATNQVRLNGLLTCFMGVGNLGLAILLAGPAGWGMYGVAAAGAIMLTAKNLIFTPLYTAHILNLRFNTFFREIVPIILSTLGTMAAVKLLTVAFEINNWILLTETVVAISIGYISVVFLILLNREERESARNLILLSSIIKQKND